MKKLIIVIVVLLISISSFAQIGINYKAVIKDGQGNVINNQEIDIRFSLEFDAGPEFGIITIYQESHTVTTTNNGIVILNIGEGTVVSGAFPQDGWNSGTYMIIEIDLEQDGTFINLGTTDFKMVPMALSARHANFAITANSANNVTGLERITESTEPGTGLPIYGWRLIGQDSANYGNIGQNAVDLSTSPNGSSPKGALGANSTAMGYFTSASGWGSTAMGFETRASGNFSATMGDLTSAPSYAETAIGAYNTIYTPFDTESSDPSDRVFVIGNGGFIRSDALIVLKSGIITAPSLTNPLIDFAGDKALITKEYADFNYLIKGGNVVSNNVGIGRETPSSLFEVAHQNGAPTVADRTNAFSIRNLGFGRSWQMYTESNGYLLLFNDGAFRGAFNASTGSYGQVSDRRTKKDITPLDNGTLNKVMQLNPVSYLMKDQTDTKRNLGLISQEVQELFPSITHYVKDSDVLALSYTELIPVLIKALQEQQDIIETQKSKDIIQDKSIEALVARLNLIESKSSN